jgi:hypothetical protein
VAARRHQTIVSGSGVSGSGVSGSGVSRPDVSRPRVSRPPRRRGKAVSGRERRIAEALVVALCGIVVVFGVRGGIRAVGTLFSSNDPIVGERLLLPVEQQGTRVWGAPGLPPIAAVPVDVRRAIRRAAREVGVDAGFLIAVAAKESSFDPAARAEGTTALGLYQFTADTWLRVVKVFGAKHGLGEEALAITVARDGSVAMPDDAARAALLARRTDRLLSALMAAELARDNAARLARMLNRDVTPAETYIAHFLGLSQAARLIVAADATPRVSGAALLPAAATHNGGIFNPSGHAASAAALVGEIDAYFTRHAPRFARM